MASRWFLVQNFVESVSKVAGIISIQDDTLLEFKHHIFTEFRSHSVADNSILTDCHLDHTFQIGTNHVKCHDHIAIKSLVYSYTVHTPSLKSGTSDKMKPLGLFGGIVSHGRKAWGKTELAIPRTGQNLL